MSKLIRYLVLSVLLLECGPPAHAGSNAQGIAWLSWDKEGQVTELIDPPVGPTPLFVQLRNLQSISQIAIWVTASPSDSASPGYRFAWPPMGLEPDSTLGIASPTYPPQSFAGDDGYDWKIALVNAPIDSVRIVYYIVPTDSLEPVAATFALHSVIVVGSLGDIDTLAVEGNAVISPSPLITEVSPRMLQAGATTALSIRGPSFPDSTVVRLRQGETQIQVHDIHHGVAGELVVQVTPSPTSAGPYDLQLLLPDGRSTVEPSAVQIDEAFASGGKLYPSDQWQPSYTFSAQSFNTNTSHRASHYLALPACYPGWLSTGHLLITGTGRDTATALRSDIYPWAVSVNSMTSDPELGYIRYNAASRMQSSVGVLAVARNAHSTDAGSPFLRLLAHHTNGDSTCSDLKVGQQIRTYVTGTDPDCSTAYCVTQPTDTLCRELYAGPWEDDTYYFDFQEMRVPPEKRGVPIDYIQIQQKLGTTCGNPETYLFGWGLWNHFRISNPAGDTLRVQKQTNGAWRDSAYGGYRYGNVILGAKSTIGKLGCLLTCAAMVTEYFGTSCTPLEMNRFLQEHWGYDRVHDATNIVIDGSGAIGDSLTFDWVTPNSTHGGTFLIEPTSRLRKAPIATIRVLADNGASGVGRVEALHGHGQPASTGEEGYSYSTVVMPIASDLTKAWHVVGPLPRVASTPARVESTLATNHPVILHTRFRPATSLAGRHFVVADGRESTFPGSQQQNFGTYHIADPGFMRRRLTEGDYYNAYVEPKLCLPGGRQSEPSIAEGSPLPLVEACLTVSLQGPAHLEIVGPGGEHMAYDAASDDYLTNVDGADMWRHLVIEDPDDSTLAGMSVDGGFVPEPSEGVYTVTVSNETAGAYTLQVTAPDSSGAGACAFIRGSGGAGGNSSYRVLYQRLRGVFEWAVADVQHPAISGDLRVSVAPNPVRGVVRISMSLEKARSVRVDAFDVTGRCVGSVMPGELSAGVHELQWVPVDNDGQRLSSGVYFVKVSCGDRVEKKRVVVLH